MRCDRVHLDFLRANKADTRLLIAVDATQSWTKITVAQMRVCLRSFLGCLDRANEVISWDVVIKEPWRRKV